MYQLSDTIAAITTVANTDVAAGGAAVITLAADSEQRHVIDFVAAGFYAAPDANTAVVVKDTTNNTVLFQQPVTAAGPAYWQFGDGGLPAPLGAAVTITLEDGSQIKDLVVKYR